MIVPELSSAPAPMLPSWRRRLAVFAPPVVVVLFLGAMLYSLWQRQQSTRTVQDTYTRIAYLHQVRTRLVDAETGQRGYLITGDERYLAPFFDAERDVAGLLASLERAHAGNPLRLAGVRELDSLVARRFALMALPISALRSGGLDAARAQLIAGRGREAMTELRQTIAEVEAVELRQLTAERRAEDLAGLLVLALLLAGSTLVLLTATYTNRQFRLHSEALEAHNAQEQELNARLQEQALELEMQASELQAANDELSEQQAHVEAMAAELEASNEELQMTIAQLEDRTDAAEAANHAKAQFLASMSHELRTPLNAIGGYVDLLELGVHGQVTDAQRVDLERIRHNSRHLLSLINDILNFAKVQSGRLEMASADVPVPALLAETESAVRPLVDAKQITFIREEPPAIMVRGDHDRIRQILLNLLSNAVKFTDRGGAIYLGSRNRGNDVCIEVRDSGVGIPAELQQAIFDPFVQAQRGAGGSLSDGVGLGLSISRELAHAMGGDITVQSAPGQGATFTLTLPVGSTVSAEARLPELSP